MNKLLIVSTKMRQIPPRQFKLYSTLALFGGFVLLPDLYLAAGHHLLEILHLGYETVCFLFEELLGHTLHLEKYDCQLILFYSQLSIACGCIYKIWRATPRLYRSGILAMRCLYRQAVKDGKEIWAQMPGRKRVKVIAGCAAGMFGLYFWATS